MLCLEMPETIVRKISGHAPHSKEFFRYLEISQRYLDTETEKMHSKLEQKSIIAIQNKMTESNSII